MVLEECGPDVLPEDLAVAWLEHLDYSEDELGYAALNLRHASGYLVALALVERAHRCDELAVPGRGLRRALLHGCGAVAADLAKHDSLAG